MSRSARLLSLVLLVALLVSFLPIQAQEPQPPDKPTPQATASPVRYPRGDWPLTSEEMRQEMERQLREYRARGRVVRSTDTSTLSAGRSTGSTEIVSRASNGTLGNIWSYTPDISADGRYVAFTSLAENLIEDDTNGMADVFVHDRETSQTMRVSISSSGAEANDFSFECSISDDGRFVAFWSSATNLVDGDSNELPDIFLHDRDADEDGIYDEVGQQGGVSTTLVSVGYDDSPANSSSVGPDISADGRYVAFWSGASNLVSGDTAQCEEENCIDVFVYDRLAPAGQRIERVSVGPNGVEANNWSARPAISGDGRFVAFESWASNLVPGDNDETCDIFVHDRQTHETVRVSRGMGGTDPNDQSESASISQDGRFVAFMSRASNLVPGDTNDCADAFVYDMETGATTRVSVASDGTQGDGQSGQLFWTWNGCHMLSADGRFVAFESQATNLAETYGMPSVFVHDRLTSHTTLVSLSPGGEVGDGESRGPSLSGDGSLVAFWSWATNLVAGDDNWVADAFVHDTFGTISGRVTISGTAQPLAGVLVSAGEEITATTDVSGTYVLSGLPPDTYVVQAEKEDYVFSPAAITTTVSASVTDRDFLAFCPDFDVLGLEITQAVQDLDNNVHLVEGKETWVRFYVRNTGEPYTRTVPAELTLTGDGGRSETVLPFNAIEVKEGPDRGVLEESYNLKLPREWWSGTITVTAQVNPEGSEGIAETVYTNNAITVTRTFTEMTLLRVKFVDVPYGLEEHRADPAHRDGIQSWLERAYPISAVHAMTGTLPWGQTPRSIAYTDGGDWEAPGTWPRGGHTLALATDGSEVYVGGDLTAYWDSIQHRNVKLNHVAGLINGQWTDMDGGMDGTVHDLAIDGSGNVYAGGSFTHAGGVSANRIVRWNGQDWSPLGSGTGDTVYALAFGGDGSLYVGGAFSYAGGNPVGGIARWDGNNWSDLGSGTDGVVYALAVDGDDLYVGGVFNVVSGTQACNIAVLDLTTQQWSEVGGGLDSPVYALAVVGGHLYAGGAFVGAGPNGANYVARLDNDVWQPLGAGTDNIVHALRAAGDDLYVGGDFDQAGGVNSNCVARWDTGTSQWTALSIGESAGDQVTALAVDSSGTLYAGGYLTWLGGEALPSFAAEMAVVRALSQQRDREIQAQSVDPRTIYYGIIDAQNTPFGGIGWPLGRLTACGRAGWVSERSDADIIAGEEIGHALGRKHSYSYPMPPNDCALVMWPWEGCCGNEGAPREYQHPYGSISPTSDPWQSTTVYGFDARPAWVQHPGQLVMGTAPLVFTPTISLNQQTGGWKDIMTYCPNKWISNATYEAILATIQNLETQTGQGQAMMSARPWGRMATPSLLLETGDYLLVSGEIYIASGIARLDPSYVITNTIPPREPEPGDYSIVLLDADDEVLAEYDFTPVQLFDADPDIGVIDEWIPWDPDTARVAVISGTRELAMVPVSPNAPTVELLQPNGGETLDGATAVVEWEGEDADGGNLEYLLQYSADNGQTWQVVGSGIANTTTYTVELASLPGSTAGLLRVTVSDGINTAWDDSDGTFTVENKRPRPQIQSPGSGKAILPDETLMLHGVAYDVEDGTLGDEDLSWHSDIDGELGQGLVLSVSSWTAALHTITLTATDGDALTGTAAITLTVLADADGDHMPDAWESAHGLDPEVDDHLADADQDQLNNGDEYYAGSDPEDADTDNDGFGDGVEFARGSDLLVPTTGTTVSLRFSGQVQYATGRWWDFNKPAMALLPGHYWLSFDSYALGLDVGDTPVEKSIAIVTLQDAEGQGLEGGTVEYYDGSWHALPGSTDKHGVLLCVLPGLFSTVSLRMTYASATQVIAQDISANSYVAFATTRVTVRLQDHQGYPLDPGTVQYYAGESWHTFEDGTTFGGQATMELLPGTYTFRMEYAAGRNDKAQDVASDPVVLFQTGQVTQGESVTCYGYWRSGEQESEFVEPMQLLPDDYYFRLNTGTVQQTVVAGQVLNLSQLALPDLDITATDVIYYEGSAADLVAVVENIGTDDAPATTIGYHLETITGTLLITDTVPALGMSQAVTVTSAYDYSALAAGSYTLVAAVNEDEAFVEVSTANNQAELTLEVTPDLDVEATDISYGAGSAAELVAVVRNRAAVASPATTIACYHGTITGTLLITDTVPALDAGAAVTVTTAWDYAGLPEGAHELLAVANPQGQDFEEMYTTNNQRPLAMQVTPDLAILEADVAYLGGSEVEFVAVVRNLGAVTSTATTLAYYHEAITGTLVVTGVVPALGAGDIVTTTTPWDWGELEEGTYPLVAVVNQGEGSFAESYIANNQADLMLEVPGEMARAPWRTQRLAAVAAFSYSGRRLALYLVGWLAGSPGKPDGSGG